MGLPGSANNTDKRRRFFERYAKKYKFDPLNPNNWYLQSRNKIEVCKVFII